MCQSCTEGRGLAIHRLYTLTGYLGVAVTPSASRLEGLQVQRCCSAHLGWNQWFTEFFLWCPFWPLPPPGTSKIFPCSLDIFLLLGTILCEPRDDCVVVRIPDSDQHFSQLNLLTLTFSKSSQAIKAGLRACTNKSCCLVIGWSPACVSKTLDIIPNKVAWWVPHKHTDTGAEAVQSRAFRLR